MALALSQHGVVSLAQLADRGMSARAVQKRARTGHLHRIHQGVYGLVPRPFLRLHGRLLAAVLACGPGAVVSHRSAAELHGLLRAYRATIDITVPGRSGRKHVGLDIHRSRTLTDSDVTVVDGIPCTTVARTLFDIAAGVNDGQLTRAFDQAEILQVFDLRAINDQVGRNPTRKGAGAVKAILGEHYIGSAPTWSVFEGRMLAYLKLCGFTIPEVNAWIELDDGERAIRGDFVWREQLVVVMTDGHGTHGTARAFERDRRDAQRLLAGSWRPIPVTWKHLHDEPDRLHRTLATHLVTKDR